MEREDDVQLIYRILSGDNAAFSLLVEKYQKSVHALVWRKIGDFHYAEEITQDIFLKVYKNLSTLKEPSQFAGWLYVIANRFCVSWLRKQKPTMQSLEDTPVEVIEESSYGRYLLEQRDAAATEHRYEIVRKLLEKLPESERTVVTLYYLGEMTTKEIGRFLGVSVNTITSRLQRARKRLEQEAELLVQKVLGGVQISTGLRQHIMRQVAEIKPVPPSPTKPLLPWMAFGSAILLIALLLGASNRYLARFQKPYSFQAESEPTIEIIEAPIVLDIDAKPAVRNQMGRAVISDKSNGAGLQVDETLSAPSLGVDTANFSSSQWTQDPGPQSGRIHDVFATSQGVLYTATQTDIYRLPVNASTWIRINTDIPTDRGKMSMVEYDDTLYIVSTDKILASSDAGETWNAFCPRPKGYPVGLLIVDAVDATQSTKPRVGFIMYLALRDEGIFHTTDTTKQWIHLSDELTNKRISAVTAIGNTIFAGTNDGLYRFNSGVWEKIPVKTFKTTQPSKNKGLTDANSGFYRLNSGIWERVPVDSFNAIHTLVTFENSLYVGIGADIFSGSEVKRVVIIGADSRQGWIFRSTDLGESWTEITPKGKSPFLSEVCGIRLLVAGETLLAQGTSWFRSENSGKTWTKFRVNKQLPPSMSRQGLGLDEKTFYTIGAGGIYRTTNAGSSWYLFMKGIANTHVQSLIALNDRLYAHTGSDIVQSVDGGESWKSVHIYADVSINKPPRVDANSRLAIADGDLYWILPKRDELHIYRLSMNGDVFIRVQEIPGFDGETLTTERVAAIAKAERIYLPDDTEENALLTKGLRILTTFAKASGFSVSDGTFYAEFRRQLFKWKQGDPQWTNTGLIDFGKRPDKNFRNRIELGTSGETVYVGKRNGKLFQSVDSGDNWIDITSNLPLRFERFNEITFAGLRVYIATDRGVLTSQTGEHWRVLTDGVGMRIVVDRFAVDGVTVYGAGDSGIYRLDTGEHWQQIYPNVPHKIHSLVISNDKLYIATQRSGIFHIALGEESNKEFFINSEIDDILDVLH